MDWRDKLTDILLFIMLTLIVIIFICYTWKIIDGISSGSLSLATKQCLKITTGLL